MCICSAHAVPTPQGPFINPEGVAKEYTRAGEGFYTAFSGAILTKNLDRLAATVIENENGDLFFSHPFVSLRTDCYLKGEKEGDRIKMTFPQVAYVSSPTKMQSLYVMEFSGTNDDGVPNYVVSESQTLYMNIDEEGVMTLDLPNYSNNQEYPLQILGLCGEDEEWDGFGEYQMSYTPFTDQRIAPPEGLEYEEWAFIYKENGYTESGSFVNVGFDSNDKIYVQGISKTFPESWIVGRIEGNKVTFESEQYMGVDNIQYYHCYFYGGKIEMVYYPEWEEYYPDGVIAQSFILEIDKDKKEMKAEDDTCIIINCDKKTTLPLEQFWYVDFKKQSENSNLTPKEPTDLYYSPDFGIGYSSISFNIPIFNVENELLHTANLYYRIYIDGDIMTFYPDEYVDLVEELTNIPYNFSCGFDIQAYGAYHNVSLFAQGIATIGVQSVYIDSNGKEFVSAIVTYDVESGEITSGMDSLKSSNSIKSVKYYDLNGRELSHPISGVYIQTISYSDGSVVSKKIMVANHNIGY